MASLLDRIREIGTTPQPAQRGIERVLRQKTGRAAPAVGPAGSTIQEQAAIGATQEALREQTIESRIAGLQLQGREQALTEQQRIQEQQLRQQREQ